MDLLRTAKPRCLEVNPWRHVLILFLPSLFLIRKQPELSPQAILSRTYQ